MNTFNRRRSSHSSSAHLKEVKNGGKSRVKQGHCEKCSRWLLSDHDFPTTFKVLKTVGGRTWTFDGDVTVGRYPVYLIEPCWMQWDHVWMQKVREKPLRARTSLPRRRGEGRNTSSPKTPAWEARQGRVSGPCLQFSRVTRDDSQRLFSRKHSVAMLEQCGNYSKQCRNNVATLSCAKNHHCESSRVTSP